MKRNISLICLGVLIGNLSVATVFADNKLSDKSKELLDGAIDRMTVALPDGLTLSGKPVMTANVLNVQNMDEDNRAASVLSAQLSEMLVNPVKDSWPMGWNPTYYSVAEVQSVLEALVKKAQRLDPSAIRTLGSILNGRYASKRFDPIDSDRARLLREIYNIRWDVCLEELPQRLESIRKRLEAELLKLVNVDPLESDGMTQRRGASVNNNRASAYRADDGLADDDEMQQLLPAEDAKKK